MRVSPDVHQLARMTSVAALDGPLAAFYPCPPRRPEKHQAPIVGDTPR
jgi:hypothetical protein